ncbi:MAG: dihydrofolate reductase [Bacteroidales bacterium]|nr:dihydrofolate reductase [Bacteroidales bacterium]
MIAIIAAVSEDLGIGKDNELLWRIPEDLKRFKQLTSGNTVIMGRKTWMSLPVKPLPGRRNIVLTDVPNECFECSETAVSVEDALSKCSKDENVFVIGGGSVYSQFMPLADRLYITHVHQKAPADVFFPKIDLRKWKIIEKSESTISDPGRIPYTYVIYERKKNKC